MFEFYIGIVQFNFHERSELTSIFASSFTSESSASYKNKNQHLIGVLIVPYYILLIDCL